MLHHTNLKRELRTIVTFHISALWLFCAVAFCTVAFLYSVTRPIHYRYYSLPLPRYLCYSDDLRSSADLGRQCGLGRQQLIRLINHEAWPSKYTSTRLLYKLTCLLNKDLSYILRINTAKFSTSKMTCKKLCCNFLFAKFIMERSGHRNTNIIIITEL